jgi:hypothetical protein
MNQIFQITRENINVYVHDTHYQWTAVSDNGILTKYSNERVSEKQNLLIIPWYNT